MIDDSSKKLTQLNKLIYIYIIHVNNKYILNGER